MKVTKKDIDFLLLIYQATVVEAGWISQRELGSQMEISPGMAARRVMRAKTHGWIGEDTSRARSISLTFKGLNQAKQYVNDALMENLPQVSERVRARLRLYPRPQKSVTEL